MGASVRFVASEVSHQLKAVPRGGLQVSTSMEARPKEKGKQKLDTGQGDLSLALSIAGQERPRFTRLRDALEERASRQFFEGRVETKGPVVLRSNDFFKLLVASLPAASI
jgi:hypothetical protein